MSYGKYITLSNGALIPQIGLGTWLSQPHEVEKAVEIAVRAGYRHLDLARIYRNQHEVAAALKKVIPSVVKREDLFITSKLWDNSHAPEHVEAALDETLQELGLEYLDLYLIHWPVACVNRGDGELEPLVKGETEWIELNTEISLVDTWKAMIALLQTGKVRTIGVSNFTVAHIQGIYDATGVWPAVNQIEAHVLLQQDELVAFHKKHNIHITAYSPLGNNKINEPLLTTYPETIAIAKKLGATPAQVLIAWGVYRGYSVIPKSVTESRIISNFEQVTLSEEDYEALSALGRGKHRRYNFPLAYPLYSDINIYNEEKEKGAKHTVKII